MIVHYRGHLVLVLGTDVISAEIVKLALALKLPLKVSATSAEGLEACLNRAFDLIDLYLAPVPRNRNARKDYREPVTAAGGR